MTHQGASRRIDMTRAWIAVVAVAVLALPAAAYAHGDDGSELGAKNRSKACKALRAQMGAELFRETYGTNEKRRNAHGKCVSKYRHVIRRLLAQAIRECRAAQSLRSDDHAGRGGEERGELPHPDRAAFRECVKQRLRQLLAERRAALEQAAQSCDAERTADPVAFGEKYGKGREQRHAFFRCVVQTFRANQAAAHA
jgi:hypothetical protein